MARNAVAQREVVEVLQVHLTSQKVTAANAQSVIPKGFRQATDDECAVMYSRDQAFRDDLHRNGAAWTSRVGLDTSGPQGIHADGTRSPVDNLSSLSVESRAYHYSGSGPVAVVVDFLRYRGLDVLADTDSSNVARVAYVADQAQAGSVAAAAQASPVSKKDIKALRREYDTQVVNNAAIDASAFPMFKEVLEKLEHQ